MHTSRFFPFALTFSLLLWPALACSGLVNTPDGCDSDADCLNFLTCEAGACVELSTVGDGDGEEDLAPVEILDVEGSPSELTGGGTIYLVAIVRSPVQPAEMLGLTLYQPESPPNTGTFLPTDNIRDLGDGTWELLASLELHPALPSGPYRFDDFFAGYQNEQQAWVGSEIFEKSIEIDVDNPALPAGAPELWDASLSTEEIPLNGELLLTVNVRSDTLPTSVAFSSDLGSRDTRNVGDIVHEGENSYTFTVPVSTAGWAAGEHTVHHINVTNAAGLESFHENYPLVVTVYDPATLDRPLVTRFELLSDTPIPSGGAVTVRATLFSPTPMTNWIRFLLADPDDENIADADEVQTGVEDVVALAEGFYELEYTYTFAGSEPAGSYSFVDFQFRNELDQVSEPVGHLHIQIDDALTTGPVLQSVTLTSVSPVVDGGTARIRAVVQSEQPLTNWIAFEYIRPSGSSPGVTQTGVESIQPLGGNLYELIYTHTFTGYEASGTYSFQDFQFMDDTAATTQSSGLVEVVVTNAHTPTPPSISTMTYDGVTTLSAGTEATIVLEVTSTSPLTNWISFMSNNPHGTGWETQTGPSDVIDLGADQYEVHITHAFDSADVGSWEIFDYKVKNQGDLESAPYDGGTNLFEVTN